MRMSRFSRTTAAKRNALLMIMVTGGFALIITSGQFKGSPVNESVGQNDDSLPSLKLITHHNHPRKGTRFDSQPSNETKGNLVQSLTTDDGIRQRIWVLTTWRSGSTFLAEILLSHPGSFYHYEPLLPYGIHRLRNEDEARIPTNDLRQLFTCNYTNLDHYFQFGKRHSFLFSHTDPIWVRCKKHHLCFDPTFHANTCREHPYQVIKTVRLPLRYAEPFLRDQRWKMKVVFLVRDPRGMLESRKHRDWCPGVPDCDDPRRVCQDLEEDFKTAIAFHATYPDIFRVVRYEELALDVYNQTRRILEFMGIDFGPEVKKYLTTHTTFTQGGVSSTFRNSRSMATSWTRKLTWSETNRIQQSCGQALDLWGYEMPSSEQDLVGFDPVKTFDVFRK